MLTSRTRIAGAVLAACLTLLTACGADEPQTADTDDVASLATESPGTAATQAAPAGQERPLIRPDSIREEVDRLYAEWSTCLADNGSPSKGDLSAVDVDPDVLAASANAAKACANKEPERTWERAKRTDPKYADKLRDWITCIRSHGINSWEKDGALAFESLPSDEQRQKINECEMKAFSLA